MSLFLFQMLQILHYLTLTAKSDPLLPTLSTHPPSPRPSFSLYSCLSHDKHLSAALAHTKKFITAMHEMQITSRSPEKKTQIVQPKNKSHAGTKTKIMQDAISVRD